MNLPAILYNIRKGQGFHAYPCPILSGPGSVDAQPNDPVPPFAGRGQSKLGAGVTDSAGPGRLGGFAGSRFNQQVLEGNEND